MQLFGPRELREAIAHAEAGGQALHIHQIIANRDRAPVCFRAAISKGEFIAHLFDADLSRLCQTARSLGVRVVVVDRRGCGGTQHIDLCAGPLRAAYARLDEADREKLAVLSKGVV